MKTLDEVIIALEVCTSGYCSHPKHGDCPYLDERNDCDTRQRKLDALHYLKEYREQKELNEHIYAEYKRRAEMYEDWKNEQALAELPLNWDELKQMEGKPVWVEGEHGCIWNQKSWVLIRLDKENEDLIICVGTDNGHYEFAIGKEDYGTDWQAYRKERTNEFTFGIFGKASVNSSRTELDD